MCGPTARVKPSSWKISQISFTTWVTRCSPPVQRARPGMVRSTPAAAPGRTRFRSRSRAAQSVHEAAVRELVQPRGGVDADDPEAAEVALLAAAVPVGVLLRPLDRLLRRLPELGAPAEVPLGELHHLVLALQARNVAFDAGHAWAPYAISKRLRRRSSACDTSAALRRWRFRLGCFFVRMWLLYA